jgi:diguanylate cyclase (GGDEF)-like protein
MPDKARTHQPRVASYVLIYFLFYILLPVTLLKAGNLHILPEFLFYSLCLLIFFYVSKKYASIKYRLQYKTEELQEKLNVLVDQRTQEEKSSLAMHTKISRYNGLKEIIEEINKDLDLDSVSTSLVSIASSVIADNRCVSLLYLIDTKHQKLSLFKTRKAEEGLIIKAKEGDIFDHWVMKHLNPLLIEDIKNDFRFDTEKMRSKELRPVSSLISAPFVSEQRFLGLLRLDSFEPRAFTQDDLRLLMTISDIGAVAIENSELFQKTQELAIHDSLTQLYTKGYFLERLKEECKRSIRQATTFSLLMLDIDFFKNYNDQFGHTAGDIVLQKISGCITNSLKELKAVASRFGGEEFCIILDSVDKKKAAVIANSIREHIEQIRLVLRRQESHVTVSVGVANFPTDAIEENELILKADKAMYEAKQKGRNKVVSV